MAFLTREEVRRAARRLENLSPIEHFAVEVEIRIGNPLTGYYGWHEFYPPKSIPREQLDQLATRIAADGLREVEIRKAPEPLIIWFLRNAYGPKQPPLLFRVR